MIRQATPDDAPAISGLFVRARDEMTYVPRIAEHVRPLLGGWFLERAELWVAEEEGRVVGFAGVSGKRAHPPLHRSARPEPWRRHSAARPHEEPSARAPRALGVPKERWCSRVLRTTGVSSSSGSPTGRETWSISRTRSTSGVRPLRAGARPV